MSKELDEMGTIQALLNRLNHQRLPRALELKERVDLGEPLSAADVDFLSDVFEDAERARSLFAHHPETHSLVCRLANLYGAITQRALENEKNHHGAG